MDLEGTLGQWPMELRNGGEVTNLRAILDFSLQQDNEVGTVNGEKFGAQDFRPFPYMVPIGNLFVPSSP